MIIDKLNIGDAFLSSANTSVAGEDKYVEIEAFIKVFDRIAQDCNQSIYIIDHKKKDFLYVSSNELFLCGYSAEDVKNMGYSFYSKVISTEDLFFIDQINKVGSDFYSNLPTEDREHYVIEYDFDLFHLNRNKIRVNQKSMPLYIDDNGDIWLEMCIVSVALIKSVKVAIVRNTLTKRELIYSMESKSWKNYQINSLTNKELKVLQLTAQGLTNTTIADILALNINTIKFHKKNIFEKLGVVNSVEAISVASQMRIL